MGYEQSAALASDASTFKGIDETISYLPDADPSNSHSTANEQSLAPVSAKSGAEKQVLASQQAHNASDAAMSSSPAAASSSKVGTSSLRLACVLHTRRQLL